MTMPNFLLIGAQKSGTTSLYAYLKQHPQIFMSPLKEPRFFAFEGEKPNFRGPGDEKLYESIVGDIEAYRTLFEGVSKEKAIGEASVVYLYISSAPERIRHYIPGVKVIAILRNPVERAYSAFLHLTRDRKEPLRDFARALQAEEERISNNWGPIWHYRQVGFYYVQLKRYFDTFEREQIRVYLYEDLNDDPMQVMKDIYGFLGVEDAFVPEVSRRYNVSGIPTNEGWHALYSFLLGQNLAKSIIRPLLPRGLRQRVSTTLLSTLQDRTLVKPPLPTEVQQQLTELYREDILKLQELIGRDLSQWLR
jgi:Sulfotransferase family